MRIGRRGVDEVKLVDVLRFFRETNKPDRLMMMMMIRLIDKMKEELARNYGSQEVPQCASLKQENHENQSESKGPRTRSADVHRGDTRCPIISKSNFALPPPFDSIQALSELDYAISIGEGDLYSFYRFKC